MTILLSRASEGDHRALGELVPIVYRELRRVAAKYLRCETPGHTLQPTALINEAFVRLAEGAEIEYRSHTHFVGPGGASYARDSGGPCPETAGA